MAVLITCALDARAHQLKKTLPADTVIIFGDFADVPQFMLASGQIIKLPDPNAASYQHQMLALCLDKDIDSVFPLNETEAAALSESELLFSEYGISINKTA